MTTAIFIFRRDLRAHDNTALYHCQKKHKVVIPIFIFDPVQVGANPHKSALAVNFMIESLEDLKKQIPTLNICKGKPIDVLNSISKEICANAVYCNKDYTPYSIARDKLIAEWCAKSTIKFITFDDSLTTLQHMAKTENRYKQYTPFYNFTISNPGVMIGTTPPISQTGFLKLKNAAFQHDCRAFIQQTSATPELRGGTHEASSLLKRYENHKRFTAEDILDGSAGSRLSPHLRFGTISVREFYDVADEETRKQLIWREFYMYIGLWYPQIFSYAHLHYPTLDVKKLVWPGDPQHFALWKCGKTGVPIVDAGMRQLAATGYISNRMRMIVAEFLVKTLLIEWRLGEQYFATQLLDYDRCINIGNWNWVATFGLDYYIRLFNPWRQSVKFDPEAKYIKKWIPELKNESVKDIHSGNLPKYKAIVDHLEQGKKYVAWYDKAVADARKQSLK